MARQLKGSDGIRVLAISYNCFYCDPSVAYSKHIVHIYAYHGGDDLRNHLEIDAHGGNVSDLAFSNPNKQLCMTCGEDKAIKQNLSKKNIPRHMIGGLTWTMTSVPLVIIK
ncbi:Uncharacterized protein Fot_29582 [Forsythia ovata]|uniref:Uncharacterized protein n=1 Tax=Forsythia ovata TaxID=205694 RepID=A0ABD1TSA9_9LAMI